MIPQRAITVGGIARVEDTIAGPVYDRRLRRKATPEAVVRGRIQDGLSVLCRIMGKVLRVVALCGLSHGGGHVEMLQVEGTRRRARRL